MKIYTKTGDKGKTGLIGGTRVSKNNIRIEAYGTVDELNSFVGLLTTSIIPSEDELFLNQIQHWLFDVGSYLATDTSKITLTSSVLPEDSVSRIEKEIDRLNTKLPSLQSFILPGGTQNGVFCHLCRTVARRTERRLYDLNEIYPVDEQVLVFFNRLSDYFFVLSRYLTIIGGGKEILWRQSD